MSLKICVFLLFGLFFSTGAKCQKMAVKSNLLYDATATINAGMEFRLAPRWTFDLSGNYNGWTISGDRKWKHWMMQPEVRYWFCDRFAGHFLGAHALGGKYNIGNLKNSISFLGTDFSKLTDRRYQGWFIGAGVAYGHSWILSKHWNFEAEIGVGYIYTRYDVYPCAECGTRLAKGRSHHYVGPTKAALNLVYLF
ncbi:MULTISPECIES: DUF3575 domain-containing protein [Butyricimonas]|uniref:DUF3575 domain-containing protein n=1 Tax=Butyricimonas TaxID=574697 RepID=UPI001D066228|nr:MULTISPECIES: DUF3575 domain-containing protein [Butyricimonas]MCB6973924.1 DUF3575 domain-containing protein [Butyricimonas synergistica]MCG4520733.1 DUF3575 domain-containing protein [Butyricimonas sp. DFI.6.44]